MNALWLENQTLTFRNDLPIPRIQSGEALIRIRLAGICATDLEMVRGYYPFKGILGHEFIGEVVESPDGPSWIGRRVTGEINLACGVCRFCKTGRRTHCEHRDVLGILNHGGVFADYLSLPLENLHPVPDSVTDEAAVFTEPLAAALEIQEQVSIKPTDRVLLVGAGRLGQLIARTLALTGCDLEVVARHENQRKLLVSCGIPVVGEENIPEAGFDIVVEASGSPSGFDLARGAVRPRGVIVLKSTYKGRAEIDLSTIVVDEITLVGSRCGPFPPALRLLERKLVDPTPLIDSRYPLAEGLTAFEQAALPGSLKVLLTLHPEGA